MRSSRAAARKALDEAEQTRAELQREAAGAAETLAVERRRAASRAARLRLRLTFALSMERLRASAARQGAREAIARGAAYAAACDGLLARVEELTTREEAVAAGQGGGWEAERAELLLRCEEAEAEAESLREQAGVRGAGGLQESAAADAASAEQLDEVRQQLDEARQQLEQAQRAARGRDDEVAAAHTAAAKAASEAAASTSALEERLGQAQAEVAREREVCGRLEAQLAEGSADEALSQQLVELRSQLDEARTRLRLPRLALGQLSHRRSAVAPTRAGEALGGRGSRRAARVRGARP